LIADITDEPIRRESAIRKKHQTREKRKKENIPPQNQEGKIAAKGKGKNIVRTHLLER